MNEWNAASAVQLRRAIGEKRVGVEELAEFYLRRIKRYGGAAGLNAVSELAPDVTAQARRMDNMTQDRDGLPLFGLPVLIKDNIDAAGMHTTAGSLALADNIARRDAAVVANLRRNGALILGKTNMTEFANYTAKHMPGGYSSRSGRVLNAYDKNRDPGGSSTGSAVAMAAGLCAAAVGTDTQFSVVGCAADNGVTGLKPMCGALSLQGILPISHTLDSAGTLTRDFADSLLLYSGMRDCPLPPLTPIPPGKLRIAVNWKSPGWGKPSGKQAAHYEELFARLREDGAGFTEVSHAYYPQVDDIMRCEFRRDLEDYLAVSAAQRKSLAEIVEFYEANPKRMKRFGDTYLRAALDDASGKLDDPPYLSAMSERARVRTQLLDELGNFDACVMAGSTNAIHFAGLPTVALKLCTAKDGTPRGVILYGADETRLFAAALTIERYCLPVSPPSL